MEYNYNHISDEIRQLIRKSSLIWLAFMTGASLLTGTLCLLEILPAVVLWSLLWFIPISALLAFIMHLYRKDAILLARKQQISIMAYHAKQVLNTLQQQFPETFVSDCHIKMCYLAKKGIHAEAAIARLGCSIETYNALVLSFLKDSNKLEDELFDLMRADTLAQYAAKAHVLRVKANELGITSLTDTAFFHEIEAYAGALDVVRANWQKLSFELDESYDVLSEYIKSIGLGGSASDKDGNHITFKMWGKQLQEAFNALEVYDTGKARRILSELVKYPFDADITNALRGLITSIDEMMAIK